jgi:DNA-binding MarR family transcriptional regulator
LRASATEGIDQTQLARELSFSPAQISASIERLRVQGRVCLCDGRGDRRRRRWQLSASGRELLDAMLGAVGLLKFPAVAQDSPPSNGSRCREAAA